MPVYIHGPEIQSGDGAILITLDASISQTHSRTATATEHPVEQGADITDHVQPAPPTLSIQGVYSAQSLSDETAAPGRELDAWATLNQIIDDAVPVTIITSLQSYTDMILLRVATTRDGRQDIRPTLEFRQIRRVDQETVLLPAERIPDKPKRAAAAKTKDTGRQPVKIPTAEEAAAARRSLAAMGIDVIRGLF